MVVCIPSSSTGIVYFYKLNKDSWEKIRREMQTTARFDLCTVYRHIHQQFWDLLIPSLYEFLRPQLERSTLAFGLGHQCSPAC